MYNLYLFLRWPVVFGIIAALCILAFRPEYAVNLGLVSHPPQQVAPQSAPNHRPNSYARAVAKASPSVVNIYTQKATPMRRHPLYKDPYFRRYFDSSDLPGQNRLMSARGSGVIVTDTGYILTSNHLVDGVNAIVVALQDGRDAKAELKDVNEERDLAILKIDKGYTIVTPSAAVTD